MVGSLWNNRINNIFSGRNLKENVWSSLYQVSLGINRFKASPNITETNLSLIPEEEIRHVDSFEDKVKKLAILPSKSFY